MNEATRRRKLSTRERLDLFLEAKGHCQGCGWQLRPGTRWEVDHIIPLGLGGRDEACNLQVLCEPCHSGKTRTRDVPAMAKSARAKARHLGAVRSRRPMPCGRGSGWKRTFDGKILRRS
ncbi:HNH endonuclease [uncultured Alsobacter sp.]|uniref:HNH endonuclease n=1 Tax=uncultured Alsobacter sp. TaxID=1748258 RepID=UPI00345D9AFC